MHNVTKIEEFKDKRYKIYIDQEFAFVLYKGELRIYGIEEGKEITKETMDEICNVILPKRAKLRSMNLLQKRLYTRSELKRKLMDGCYPEAVIEEAIAYVEGYGYINDNTYVKQYFACKSAKRSKMKMQLELRNKGISKECLEEVFGEMDPSIIIQCECTAIKRELRKRNYLYDAASYEERQKTISFLRNKGYEISLIKDVMDGNYLT